MKRYKVKKQWRAVGACEYDIFHRDRKNDPDFDDIVGEPEELWSVIDSVSSDPERHTVLADCYSKAHAKMIASALNRVEAV